MSGQKSISSNQQNKNLPQGQDISASSRSRSIQSFEECLNTQNYQEDIDMLCDSKQYDLQMNQSNSSSQKKSKKDQKESKKKRKSQLQLLFQNTSIKEKENINKRKNGQTAQHRKEQQEEDEHEKDLQQDDEGEEKKEVIHDSVHYAHEQEKINAKTSFSAVILKQSRNKYRYTNSFTKSIRWLLGHHMSQLFKDEINAHFRKKFPSVKTQQQFDKLTKESKINCLKLFNWKKLPKIPKQSLRQLENKYPDENIRKSYVLFFQEEFQLLFKVYYDTQLRRYENELDQKKSNYSKFIDNTEGKQFGTIMNDAKKNYAKWEQNHLKKKYNCDQKQSKERQTHI